MSKSGYSGPADDQEPEDQGDDRYTVVMQRISVHDGVCAVVLKNGRSIGYLPCTSEEEFEWIRGRLTGTRQKS